MKKCSQLIEEIKANQYQDLFKSIYVDENKLDSTKERYIQALEKFITLYGDQEVEIYSAPGRSEKCGNHTDHQLGKVVAGAINLDIIAIVSKSEEIKVVSDEYDLKPIQINDLDKKEAEVGTSVGLVRGVTARFKELGYQIGGFKAYMTSEVLQGSGLSSSAAFEVMIGTILSGLYNEMKIDPVEIAKIGQYSENVYFEKPCGLMDQCASSVGSLIHIDFNDDTKVTKIDVDFESFNHSLCIVDVHASHADLTADYASIPAEMKSVAKYFNQEVLANVSEQEFYHELPNIRKQVGDRAVLRAMHLFAENKRVDELLKALNQGDFKTFKEIITASGNSSFKYLQNVYSNFYVDKQAVSIALALSEQLLQDKGVCRVHGGGFAGTIQAFVENDYVETYRKEMDYYFGEGSCHVLKIRKQGGIKVL